MNSIKKIIKPKIYYTISEIAICEIAPPFCNKCKQFMSNIYCKSKYIRDDCSLKHILDDKSVFKKI